MKKHLFKNALIVSIVLLLNFSCFAQESGFNVFGTQTNPFSGPFFLITLDTLNEAKTLNDINTRYPSSWVERYISVEITSTCKGIPRKAASTDDRLTPEQIDLLKMADHGCKIDVQVHYIPENTLKDNPPREMNFSLTTVPIFEAKYPGGPQLLQEYLQESIMDHISETSRELIKLAKIRFNINEEGKVSDVQVFQTSEDEEADKLILESINKMPKWSPATNSEGMKITQEFEFRMGTDLLRCDYQY